MKRIFITGIMLFLLLASSPSEVFAQSSAEPSQAKLGKKVPNLTFTDTAGKPHRLYDLKNKKAVVFVFLSFDCPVSNGYVAGLVDLQADMERLGVVVWGLTTNLDESPEDVARHVKNFGITFPVFRDVGFKAVEALDATITPEAFVLDGNFTLQYRGRIDDGYSERLKRHAKVQRYDLNQALAEVITGRPVSVPATRAIGCFIPRDEKAIAKNGPVTYHRDVVPILQRECQNCHRPGEVGPFSLMTYKQAVNWAPDIKTFTQNRFMPPWKASEGGPFHNERRLNDKDLATLAAWVDGNTPEGDPKDAPAARQFSQGWQLGTPDLVLSPTEEFTLGPDGRDVFRCYVMPTNLQEDVYVSAVEVRPGNTRVVHHVLLFLDTSGQGRKLEKALNGKIPDDDAHPDRVGKFDIGPGYSMSMGVGFVPQGGLGGWAPGLMPRYLPEGVGYYIPKGADVVMQVHYHRDGRVETDKTQVGLYFRKTKVDHPLQGGAAAGQGSKFGPGPIRLFFSIPAGEPNFKLQGQTFATADFTLLGFTPHMHQLGKSIRLTMTPPGESPKTLIGISDWDYNWQEMYTLKEPIQVKAGTRFEVEAVYDNSDKNPRNPSSPPRRVTFGEQTTNEMCFVFMNGYSNTKGRRLPLSVDPPAK